MIDNGVGFNYEYIAVETDNPKRYRVGTVMNLACDPGFSLSAPSSITCLESGNWNYQGEITCTLGKKYKTIYFNSSYVLFTISPQNFLSFSAKML